MTSSRKNSAFSLLAMLLASLVFTSCESSFKKPNVLLIITDDQGWGDLSANGNTVLNTPHLDTLAANSISFDRYYVSPLCAPTRASLLTGRYHLRTGTISVTGGLERMNTSEFTLAEAFLENGYRTACFGKWHNGEHYPESPLGQGFQEFEGFCAGHWNNYFDTEIQKNNQSIQFEGYLPDHLTNRAIDFMKENSENSFFCYLPLNIPHSPHQVPDAYFDKYKAKGLGDELAAVYGMVENIDYNIGRTLDFLKKAGLEENTIVIFMSDNGPNGYRYNGNMKGIKGSVNEGGVRSPLFIKWPKKWKKGKLISQIAAHIDIFPTLVNFCGLKLKEIPTFDGIDLSDFIEGKSNNMDREIYSLVTYDNSVPDYPASIRTNTFRWVKDKNEFSLYNMHNDPNQLTNLIDSLPEVHRVFNLKYNKWFADVFKNIDAANRKSIPLGYASVERLELQAPQATFTGKIHFFEGHGWANDWLTNWTLNDTIKWQLHSISATKYKVYLKYTCEPEKVGSKISLSLNNQSLEKEITEPFDPPNKFSPDRITRKEAYEKPWKRLLLGEIEVPKGSSEIILIARDIKNESVGQVKGLTFELLKN